MSGKDTVHEIMPNNPQALAKKKKKPPSSPGRFSLALGAPKAREKRPGDEVEKKLNFIHSLKSLKPHSYTCQDRNAISVSLVSLPNYKEPKWALDSS